MKLVFFHIPKTGGSSVSKVLEQKCQGLWLKNAHLNQLSQKEFVSNDYFSGHFTRQEFMAWASQNEIQLNAVKFLTVIRHPLDQLLSNLSFPYELASREYPVSEPWMKDMLLANPFSAEEIARVLADHPWILNLQWQYLVTGSDLRSTMAEVDKIVVFPQVGMAIDYVSSVMQIDAPNLVVHENPAQKFIEKTVFSENPLREIIVNQHALDIHLYNEVVKPLLNSYGFFDGLPASPESFLDHWLSC